MLKQRGAPIRMQDVKSKTPYEAVSQRKDKLATEVASLAIPPVATEWFCLPVLATLATSGLEVLVPKGKHTSPRGTQRSH